jgi:hypothetical protein
MQQSEIAPRFAHLLEREIARIFDGCRIEWQYEPHTIVLDRSSDGTGGRV